MATDGGDFSFGDAQFFGRGVPPSVLDLGPRRVQLPLFGDALPGVHAAIVESGRGEPVSRIAHPPIRASFVSISIE